MHQTAPAQSQRNGSNSQRGENFVEALSAYSRFHRAQHWSGTFGEFLRTVVPATRKQLARTSHEYLWDMLAWFGRNSTNGGESAGTKELFKRELFGIDEPLGRIVDYFKAAAVGLRCRPPLAAVARPAVGRQIHDGDSASSAVSRNTATRTKVRCTRCKARRCTSRR